jgi:tetratricopeptide (TPR) repeat protein
LALTGRSAENAVKNFASFLKVHSVFLTVYFGIMIVITIGSGVVLLAVPSSFPWSVPILAGSVILHRLTGHLANWLANYRTGQRALKAMRYQEAEREFRLALDAFKGASPNDPRKAVLLQLLATSYRGLEDYRQAEAAAQEAYEINENVWGPSHARTLSSKVALANSYLALARFDRAEALFQQVLDREEEATPMLVGVCLANLGECHLRREQHAQAELYYRRDLDILKTKVKGGESLLGLTYANLSAVCCESNVLDDAEAFDDRARSIFDETLDRDHYYFAVADGNLARIRLKQGRYAEAEELSLESMRIKQKCLGEQHSSMGESLDVLARVCLAQGRLVEAESNCARGMTIRQGRLAANDPTLAESYSTYASILAALGKPVEANQYRQKARDIRSTQGMAAAPSERDETAIRSP